jgi:hypothetical protein
VRVLSLQRNILLKSGPSDLRGAVKSEAQMRFESVLAGVVFTADCENGRFRRGQVCCPNCRHEIEQQVPADIDP